MLLGPLNLAAPARTSVTAKPIAKAVHAVVPAGLDGVEPQRRGARQIRARACANAGIRRRAPGGAPARRVARRSCGRCARSRARPPGCPTPRSFRTQPRWRETLPSHRGTRGGSIPSPTPSKIGGCVSAVQVTLYCTAASRRGRRPRKLLVLRVWPRYVGRATRCSPPRLEVEVRNRRQMLALERRQVLEDVLGQGAVTLSSDADHEELESSARKRSICTSCDRCTAIRRVCTAGRLGRARLQPQRLVILMQRGRCASAARIARLLFLRACSLCSLRASIFVAAPAACDWVAGAASPRSQARKSKCSRRRQEAQVLLCVSLYGGTCAAARVPRWHDRPSAPVHEHVHARCRWRRSTVHWSRHAAARDGGEFGGGRVRERVAGHRARRRARRVDRSHGAARSRDNNRRPPVGADPRAQS